jgi:hypothetical protein
MRATEATAAAEKTYRAIGRFIFEFSQVEYTVRHYLAEEIRLKEEFFSAIISYDVGVLVNAAKEVFKKSWGETESKTITALLNSFYEFNNIRKQVAHGLWVPFRDEGTVHYVSRNKLAPACSSGQAAALEKSADELCQLRAKLEHAFTFLDLGRLSHGKPRRSP